MAIRINNERICGSAAEVAITRRPKTVLLEAYHWAGHQSSAAEGPIEECRIVRPTVSEAVAELERRWTEQAGGSTYVGFGGQFRHVAHYTRDEVQGIMDDIQEALEKSALVAV